MLSIPLIVLVLSLDLSRLTFLLLVAVPAVLVCGSLIYLLALLLAAVLLPARRETAPGTTTPDAPKISPRLTVVIPAHNEEMVLAATLHSLRQQDYAPDSFDVVVVADNCTDTTSEIARSWGAGMVLERTNTVQRGKGYALEWAFSYLLDPALPVTPADAYIIVDADTHLAPDFLSVMARRLAREQKQDTIAGSIIVLQGRYGVLNPEEGWRTALMTAAFDLCNHVRLRGAANLGLSVGLKGNGMAFTRAVLDKASWQGRSITEDIDYGLDLLLEHNVNVGYEPAARVWAQMPTSAVAAASQRERWERGRYRLLGQRVPGLLFESLRLRRIALFVAAADLMIPPLAELFGLLILWGTVVGIGIVTQHLTVGWLWAWLTAATSFVVYVLAGLKAAGAKRETFRALLHVPFYMIWKLALYLSRFVSKPLRRPKTSDLLSGATNRNGQDADDWIRTERTALSPGSSPAGPLTKVSTVKQAVLKEEQSR